MNGIVGHQTASSAGTVDTVPISVEAGTLVLAATNTRIGTTAVSSGATLQLGNGGTTGIVGAAGGTIANDGTVAYNHDGTTSLSVPTVISGSGAVRKLGGSTIALTGLSTYSGTTTVEAGTLRIGNHLDNSAVTVQSGATLGAGDLATRGTGTVKSLTFASGAKSTFRASLTTPDQIVVSAANGLTISGPTVITPVAVAGLLPGDTITILDYNGTLNGSPSDLQLAAGSRFQLIHNTTDTSFQLQYTGGSVVWKGNVSTAWDLDTTTNWVLASDSSATHFLQGDQVLFDDTAATGTVVLSGTLQPVSVTFNNSSLAYTLTGTAISGTTGVTKTGTASVTLAEPSTYTGTTDVQAGTLVIGDGTTNGDVGSGAVTVASGATLRFNRTGTLDYKTSAKMRNVSGAGSVVVDGGALFFNYPGTGLGFAETGSWNNFSGSLLVKGGSEFQTIRNGATAMGTGTVTLGDATTSGSLSQIEGNWTWTTPIILTGSDNRIINRSATAPRLMKLQGVISGAGNLTFQDATTAMTNVETGIILTGTNTMSGTVTIPAGVPVRVGGVPGNADTSSAGPSAAGSLGAAAVTDNGILTFSRTDSHAVANSVSGTGKVTIGLTTFTGTATQAVTFTGTKTYSGITTIHNGALYVNTALPNSAVTVEATGTLGGSGTLGGAATVAGTLAPGNAGVGTLTSTADIALNAGSSIAFQLSDWNGAAGSGYDTVSAATLTVGSSSGTPATIVISPASLANFSETNRTFTIATTTGGISGYTAGSIVVNAGGFAGTGTWSVQNSGNTLQLVYTAPVLSGYDAWAVSKGLSGAGAAQSADPDHDGVPNVLEFLFGMEPNSANAGAASLANLPTTTTDGSGLHFVYRRNADSVSAVTPVVKYSTDLNDWTPATDGVDGVTIAVEPNGFASGLDKVTVNIPAALTGTGKLFARLGVTLP